VSRSDVVLELREVTRVGRGHPAGPAEAWAALAEVGHGSGATAVHALRGCVCRPGPDSWSR
jgi:hypothetical protein